MKEMSNMKPKLKQIDCSPECGFLIRSHDEDEVTKMAKEHVKNVHGMKVSEMEMEEKIKMV